MAWKPMDVPLDPANARYGVVASVPMIIRTVLIWQDTENAPTAPLDMEALSAGLRDLPAGFHELPELKIFAEVQNADPAPAIPTPEASPAPVPINPEPVAPAASNAAASNGSP